MTDNRKSNLLHDYIKRAERMIGAKEFSLVVGPDTFDAIVNDIRPAGHNQKWNGYPVSLNVGMACEVLIVCFITDADDNEYQAVLVIRDYEDIDR